MAGNSPICISNLDLPYDLCLYNQISNQHLYINVQLALPLQYIQTELSFVSLFFPLKSTPFYDHSHLNKGHFHFPTCSG